MALTQVLQETSVTKKWRRLASRLGLSLLEQLYLHYLLMFHRCSIGDVIVHILEIWGNRYPTQAVVGVLLYHLLQIGCGDSYEIFESNLRYRIQPAAKDHMEQQSMIDIESQRLYNPGKSFDIIFLLFVV